MICYGLDLKAPTTIKDDDGWRPVMQNAIARMKFSDVEALYAFKDALLRTNQTLEIRVVEITDDQPYSRL